MLRPLILPVLMFALANASPHPPATTAAPLVASQPTYDTKFDNIDIDEVLSQERLLRSYIRCLESTGPCTPDAKMLKEILPDAISTDCVKCSEKQKYSSEKVMHFLINNRPEDWARLETIYDPQGNYRHAYLTDKTNSTNGEQTPPIVLATEQELSKPLAPETITEQA